MLSITYCETPLTYSTLFLKYHDIDGQPICHVDVVCVNHDASVRMSMKKIGVCQV